MDLPQSCTTTTAALTKANSQRRSNAERKTNKNAAAVPQSALRQIQTSIESCRENTTSRTCRGIASNIIPLTQLSRATPRRQLRNIQQLRRRVPTHPPAHPGTSNCRTGKPSQSSAPPSPPAPSPAHDSRARPSPRPETPARRQPRSRSSALRSLRLHQLTCRRHHRARLVIHIAIPPQIARIVIHNALARLCCGSRSAYRAINSE